MLRAFVTDGVSFDEIRTIDTGASSIWDSVGALLISRGIVRNNRLDFVGIIDSEELSVTLVCLPKTMLSRRVVIWDPESEITSDLTQVARLILKLLARYFRSAEYRRLSQASPSLQPSEQQVSRYVAAFDVVDDWKRTGPLTEWRKIFSKSGRGQIDWSRTLAQQIPLVQNGAPVYPDTITRLHHIADNHLIAQIQRACVSCALSIVGWLDSSSDAIRHEVSSQIDESVYAVEYQWVPLLHAAMQNEFGQDSLRSLTLLLSFLLQAGGKSGTRLVGVQDFELVWQGVLASVLGDRYVEEFQAIMPQPRWFDSNGAALALPHGALIRQIPDIVFDDPYDGTIHVVDAKYYDISRTFVGWSDIGKQFLYAHCLQQVFPLKRVCNSFVFPGSATERTVASVKVLDAKGSPVSSLGSIRCNYWDMRNVLSAYLKPSAAIREQYRSYLRYKAAV